MQRSHYNLAHILLILIHSTCSSKSAHILFHLCISLSCYHAQFQMKTHPYISQKLKVLDEWHIRLYLIYKRKRDALAVEYIPYFLFLQINLDYIMPPIPGCPAGMAGAFSSGLSVIKHSVVKNKPAIEDAFSSATRATFAGSMIPALRISS